MPENKPIIEALKKTLAIFPALTVEEILKRILLFDVLLVQDNIFKQEIGRLRKLLKEHKISYEMSGEIIPAQVNKEAKKLVSDQLRKLLG